MAKPASSTKARRAGADKAIHGGEDKLAEAVRTANIGRDGYDGSHKTTVCYNAACPDYRRERHGSTPCACKRTRVDGAGR